MRPTKRLTHDSLPTELRGPERAGSENCCSRLSYEHRRCGRSDVCHKDILNNQSASPVLTLTLTTDRGYLLQRRQCNCLELQA